MGSQLSTLSSQLRARRARGFALLITVTLLAFIVVVLVGLAVFTRVETSIAGNSQRQAQARENALLALNVALGQLQKYAGPDQRVTATAQNFNGTNGTRYYTGVWHTDPAATDAPTTPLTWLVSGNEGMVPDTSEGAAAGATVPAPRAVTPEAPGASTVDLIGRNSLGTATRTDYVVAPLQDIKATGVPGTSATTPTTIGRYAWWVGDQGVKAPVAVPDTTSAITFAPYDSDELRARMRQQLPLGGAATTASDGTTIFEPRDSNNASLVANQKITQPAQLAFLRTSSNAQVGLARLQSNFHLWSPNNLAVLANTKTGGLRQDLSLKPDLLGAPFAAWVNYPAYVEKLKPDSIVVDSGSTDTTNTATAPTISPAYGDDPLRRRHVMTPAVINTASGGAHQATPILSYFELRFRVSTVGQSTAANSPLEVRAAWRVSLWNPYTTAFVPEQLQLRVSGLNSQVEVFKDGDQGPQRLGQFVLSSSAGSAAFTSPLTINLPWDNTTGPEGVSLDDRQSWLPGRVYSWRSAEDTTKGPAPDNGYVSRFYTKSYSSDGAGNSETNQGVQRSLDVQANGTDKCHLELSGGQQNLSISLYAIRNGSPVRLASFTSPNFSTEFPTTQHEASDGSYQFGYVFWLKESFDTLGANPSEWLTTPDLDFRRSRVPSAAFLPLNENPAAIDSTLTDLKISNPSRLLDRASDSLSYNEDVPVFELPRAPILSVGALQHFRITFARPFMIGNSWGVQRSLNGHPLGSLFDQFFFSGVVDGVTPAASSTGDLLLPNSLLKPLRKPDGGKVTVDEIRATATVAAVEPPPPEDPAAPEPPDEVPPDTTIVPDQTDARSSKFFLQAGAFNLNSTKAASWAAVLRSVRFPTTAQAFSYLNASETTGTAADTERATVDPSSDAQFFRFPQSAQETYKADPGRSATGDEAVTPPNTHLFRRGMRTLSNAQLAAFSARIVELMAAKHADSGPFRSLEEFLSPLPLFAGVDAEGNAGAPRSLLEAAIADASLNADVAEFSSQWLTQGDIMTSLAPILFPRSDTFVIRTYGEAVNPGTSATEGRAWAEAIVQRVPDYFDPSMPAESLPAAFEPSVPPATPDAPATSTPAQTLNKLYGRRFKVVLFRWLTRSDI